MIEFSGALSNESQKFLLGRLSKLSAFCALIACLICSIPLIVMMIVWREMTLFCATFIGLAVLIFVINAIPKTNPQTRTLVVSLPNAIFIDKEQIERSGIYPQGFACRKVNDVKNVLDFGAFYVVNFYFPHKDLFFLCQKDLITQGTIEEFESLFADKIVRKKFRK